MENSYDELDPQGILMSIYSRTTCRDFIDAPIEDSKAQLVLEAARFAPNSGNIQNWEFIIVKEARAKHKVAEACFEQMWLSDAAMLIIIVTDEAMAKRFYYDDGPRYSMQAAAMAAENMLVAAKSLGLGSAFVSAFDEAKLKEALSIPDYVKTQGVVAIGLEKYNGAIKDRKTLYDVCYVKKYGNRIQNEDFVLYDLNIIGRLKEGFVATVPKVKDALSQAAESARFELLHKQLALKNRQIKSLKEDLQKMQQKTNVRQVPAQPGINVHNTFFEGPWSYHVLKRSKGIEFPAQKDQLLQKLSGIKVLDEPIESIIERIDLPVENHAALLKKIKEAASKKRA